VVGNDLILMLDVYEFFVTRNLESLFITVALLYTNRILIDIAIFYTSLSFPHFADPTTERKVHIIKRERNIIFNWPIQIAAFA